jgi:hypothetical protein
VSGLKSIRAGLQRSIRNGVQNQPGTLFSFVSESRSPSPGFPTNRAVQLAIAATVAVAVSIAAAPAWGEELWLRTGAGNHDLGYPRTVQRPDGKIVTAYYYNDKADGERYIAATIWQP